MIVESDYRGFRIAVQAIAAAPGGESGRRHADVRMRRILSQNKPRHDVVSCYKLRPDHAEHAGLIWAKRWVDANGEPRGSA